MFVYSCAVVFCSISFSSCGTNEHTVTALCLWLHITWAAAELCFGCFCLFRFWIMGETDAVTSFPLASVANRREAVTVTLPDDDVFMPHKLFEWYQISFDILIFKLMSPCCCCSVIWRLHYQPSNCPETPDPQGPLKPRVYSKVFIKNVFSFK